MHTETVYKIFNACEWLAAFLMMGYIATLYLDYDGIECAVNYPDYV